MNFEDYLKQSERTEKKFDDGMNTTLETMAGTLAVFHIIEGFGMVIGQLKKELIYGASPEKTKPKVMAQIERLEKHVAALDNVSEKRTEPTSLGKDRAETLHALLGMVSEMAEIIELVLPYIEDSETIDPLLLGEEFGDLYWYMAQFQRQFGLDEGMIRKNNIAKLRERFPDKFDEDLALNRDTDKEREALEE